MMRRILIMLVIGTLTVGVAGCVGGVPTPTPTVSPDPSAPGTPGRASAEVPDGFVVRTGDGFSLAVPKDWADIPAKTRSYPQATMEIGVPFTGQSTLQPTLVVWVDRTQDLGTATSQAQLTQTNIRSQIPDAKVGELATAQVSGAVSAVWFEYSYHMDAATSVLDTKIDAADYRVRDLTVQVDGKPQFGFRYFASAADFSDQVWQQMLDSIVVRADK